MNDGELPYDMGVFVKLLSDQLSEALIHNAQLQAVIRKLQEGQADE